MVDADTVLEPDAIRRLIQPLAHPAVGAVSGNTKVGNRRGLLGRWQHLEYCFGFNLDRRMFEVLECMITVPGAIGAFRRDAALGVGGVSTDTLAEDTDLTMALWRAGFGGWSTRRPRSPGPRCPPRCGSCGASATAGASARCRRLASTRRPYGSSAR